MHQHWTNRSVLCMLVGASLCVACMEPVSRSASIKPPGPGRFFFGRSSRVVNDCPTAWLLYLGGHRGNAGLFVVASMERFSKYEVGGNGSAYFEWSGLGIDYRFDGTVIASQIEGKIQVVDRRSRVATYLCSITAAELPLQPTRANPGPGVGPDRYSNIGYSDWAGDLTGVDIRFFSTSQGTQGMITFYQSYWFEPTNRPLVLSRIEVDGRRIRFAVETPDGVGRYHLLLTPTGALFGRDDVAPEDRGKDVPLKRTPDALPSLN
jgi:hypothetical protein